jgi:acetate kinase
MADRLLCLNSGSSSLKFAVYRLGGDERLARGAAEHIGSAHGRFWLQCSGEPATMEERAEAVPGHAEALRRVFDALAAHGLESPAAVGHRVVHGGADYTAARPVDATLVAALRALVPLARLHLPSEIAIIEAVTEQLPGVPQVACFDTAFHRAMPERAQRFALPRDLWDVGIRRYGFHGLSYEYVVAELGSALGARAVIAHLGSGASLAALRDGRPVDTTMGLTPLGGLIMGTRPGDLDPGILLHLMSERGYDARGLGTLLNERSGLLGISGLSADMKTLLGRRDGDPRAAEAVRMFCDSVRKHVGAFAAVLGGLETLVFTGAIGERATAVRAEICEGLGYLGIQLDARRNAASEAIVSAPSSACIVRVVYTDEEAMIARHTSAVLGGARGRPRPPEPAAPGGRWQPDCM